MKITIFNVYSRSRSQVLLYILGPEVGQGHETGGAPGAEVGVGAVTVGGVGIAGVVAVVTGRGAARNLGADQGRASIQCFDIRNKVQFSLR